MKKISNLIILCFVWLMAISLIVEKKSDRVREAELDLTESRHTTHDPLNDAYCQSEEMWRLECNRAERQAQTGPPEMKYYMSNDGKYGLVDIHGNVLVEAVYDEMAYASLNEEYGEALFRKGENWAIINYKGETVVDLSLYKGFCTRFSQGMMTVTSKESGKTGFINRDGKAVLPFIYDSANNFEDSLPYASASIGDKWGVIDTEGNWVLEPKYGYIYEIVDVDAFIVMIGDDFWEVNSNGKKIEQVHLGC